MLGAAGRRPGHLSLANGARRGMAVACRALMRAVIFFVEISRAHVAVLVCHFLDRTFLLAPCFDRIAIGRHVSSLAGVVISPDRAHHNACRSPYEAPFPSRLRRRPS